MSSDALQPIRGMSDITAPEIFLWQQLENTARKVLSAYGITELRTPIVEQTAVFLRSLGDTTDVVQKEMYRFEDRGGRDLALRPEGTAGIIRHIAGAGQEAQDARVYYIGPMFRAERPAAGRRRQFHQLGVEAMGAASPAADVEMIALQAHLLESWGIRDFIMQVNTRGVGEDHAAVAEGLREALKPHLSELCEDCQRRFDENPLRIVDCKNPQCREIVSGIPAVTSFMSQESRDYLDEVLQLLQRLEIPAVANPTLVRGLDYYAHTVWEVTHSGLGAQDALSGGGRYALKLGRGAYEGVGFAIGLERIVAVLMGQGIDPATLTQPPRVWLVAQGEAAVLENMILMQSLRLRGISAMMDLRGRSMKAQLRAANKAGCPFVVIRGDQEMEQGTFQLKDMQEGSQTELAMPELLECLLAADGS